MDFNKFIEQEIEKQVSERIAKYKEELESYKNSLKQKYRVAFAKMVNDFLDDIDDITLEQFGEVLEETKPEPKQEIVDANKCVYKDCKNFRNGVLDDFCKDCDSRLTKSNKNNIAEKIKDTIKSNKETFEKEIKEENIKDVSTDDNLKDLNENKIIDVTLDKMKDLLESFGISKNDLKNAKVKILNNKDAYNELTKIYDAFDDIWNFNK